MPLPPIQSAPIGDGTIKSVDGDNPIPSEEPSQEKKEQAKKNKAQPQKK